MDFDGEAGFRYIGTARRWSDGKHHRGRRRQEQCARGHNLVVDNLVPSSARKGRRACLTCARASTHISNKAKAGVDVTREEAIVYVIRRWPEMAKAALGIA